MKRYSKLIATLLAFALLAAACGGSDDDNSSADDAATETTADDAATDEPAEEPADEPAEDPAAEGLARAQAIADGLVEPGDEIGPTIPLGAVPPEGLTVAWLACEVTCDAFTSGFEEATDALGWNLETISTPSFDAGPSVLQAIDLGADFIAITGTPPALIADQIAAAKEAGIGIYQCFETTVPDPDVNNIFMQCANGESVYVAGGNLANKIIAETGGDANVLYVYIPDFAVLVSERDGAADAYAENCPGCTFSELAVTLDQLFAGDVPGAIVSALQADPDVDWVHLSFDGMQTGVLDTLEAADLLDRVKVAGVDLDAATLPDIISGRYEFWTTNPIIYASWVMVDGMARTSVGMDIPTDDRSALPSFIVETPEVAQQILDQPFGEWSGPDTMEDQFKALWGVG